MSQEPMDWDKMWKHLEPQKGRALGVDDLTDKEIEMLRFAEQTRNKLNGIDAEGLFPTEVGWSEVSRRKRWKITYRLAAYAASLIFFSVVGVWGYYRLSNTADMQQGVDTAAIKLTLGDGQVVTLEDQNRQLQDAGALIAIGQDGIAYNKLEISEQNPAPAMNRLEVPFGKRTQVTLADGTKIWVNAGTVLQYPARFEGDKREVYLEGEAYFDVIHNANQPFIVHAQKFQVQVLGTAFGVSTFNGTTQAALVEGKVTVKAGGKTLNLAPGEVASFDVSQSQLTKQTTDLRPFIAWKDRAFYFENTNLDAIAARLGREYGYTFTFEDPALKDLRFTIHVQREDSLQTVLDYLMFSTEHLRFEISGKQVNITNQ